MKTLIRWQVRWDWESCILRIDQLAFICELVQKKNISDCNLVSTPIKAENFIERLYKRDYKEDNIKAYQYLIGKLIYLSYRIQPDVLFVVGQLSKPNPDSQIRHLKAAKQVVWYIKGIMHLKIIYGAFLLSKKKIKVLIVLLPFGLIEYAKNNYASNPKDRKLVIEYCFFFHRAVVS